jgi:hypothetical protein
VHAVLHGEPDRADAEGDEALKEAAVQPHAGGLFADHHGPELALVADEPELLAPEDDRDQGLGLRGLRGLFDNHLAEAQLVQAVVAGPAARGADHVRGGEQLELGGAAERPEALLVVGGELPELVLEGLQAHQVGPLERPHLRVEVEELDLAGRALSGLGAQADDLEPGHVDLFRERWSTATLGGAHTSTWREGQLLHVVAQQPLVDVRPGRWSQRASGPAVCGQTWCSSPRAPPCTSG